MRILVLGHTGYLGRHVAAQLGALGSVFGGGRSPDADLRVDLATADPGRLAENLADLSPDAVVNCSGSLGADPVTDAEVNARGPAVLCAALRRAAPAARLVHLGSAAEYGACEPGVPVTEDAPTRPATSYGATKLAGTVAVASSGLDAVVLRVGNPIGPGATPMSLPGGTALRLRRAGVDRDAVVRFGDLSAHRDFVDVRDLARAVAAATASGPLPRILNISGGRAVPIRELVRELAVVAGFRGRIEEAGVGSVRSARVAWQCSDITAAREALGWEPRFTLTDSLAALWASLGAPGEADSPA
ncbi:NAD(P)-dependent oxidoreductase [Streptomyces tirandamycinicus]|uniref:NAD-dependent epimerase/dehydratase family protein n=1 Tax=Streptomyces TaxID=1883 RepID=UPI00147B74E6|nr:MULTISPECIES: NAD(P)-dependent oxidoreductase [Streptomyces]MCY0981138.1 NAD(P)-dependent oxidoreductase [Streptomyces tirandamycinicus]NNJ05380.1 NAD(P)-dependent oxidoreductase [Streptomyces sp. PKU-MA01144]